MRTVDRLRELMSMPIGSSITLEGIDSVKLYTSAMALFFGEGRVISSRATNHGQKVTKLKDPLRMRRHKKESSGLKAVVKLWYDAAEPGDTLTLTSASGKTIRNAIKDGVGAKRVSCVQLLSADIPYLLTKLKEPSDD